MFENYIKNFIRVDKKFESIEQYNEFEKARVNINIKRSNYPILILIPLNIILIFIDIFYYNCLASGNKPLYYLYLSHIIMTIVAIAWFFYYKFLFKRISLRSNKIIYCIFCSIIFYWCIFMSIDLFYNTSQISAYIIISFCISALVYFPPIISITNNLVASIVILIYLLSLPSGTKGVMNSIVNVIFTLIFSSIISYSIYTYHANDYINNSKLIKFNKKLEIAEKIRTDFFANVSHELKTPLNILYTANQMIEVTTINDNYKNEKFSKYMKICKQNTNRLHRLISNLIDITKIDSASFKLMKTNCDIVNLVEDITLSAVCYVESRGISLIFDTDIEELIIACDPDNIERIILNLLSNAIKFTKSGGEINVEIKTDDENVFISVIDTGIGIPIEMQEKIFDRFTQVDRATYRENEGSGIGLALVKSIVELHNGNIELKSELNKGSTFTVSLPIVKAKEEKILESKNAFENNVERVSIEFSDIYS